MLCTRVSELQDGDKSKKSGDSLGWQRAKIPREIADERLDRCGCTARRDVGSPGEGRPMRGGGLKRVRVVSGGDRSERAAAVG